MASARGMEIDIVPHGVCSVVHVRGDIDWNTSPGLRAAILDLIERRSQKRVIVNLKEACRLDSSGIASFIEAFGAAQKSGARLILSGLSKSVRRALELTGFNRVFELTDTVEQALQ